MAKPLDWTHLQSFLAVADAGSLSGAARVLGGSQPTMGRHIGALESDLGVRLFDRVPGGLELTPTGADLLERAQPMTAAANQLALAAQGRAEAIAGTIRITASEIMATYVLPDILAELHLAEPEIQIELVASDRTENLLRRDADIAVRMFQPTQADIIARKVADLGVGIYAANEYLARTGRPEKLNDILDHDVVGYDRGEQIIRGFREAGVNVSRDFFSFRTDNQVAAWRMVLAGWGIGFNQLSIGENELAVQRLFPDLILPTIPVWLAAHAELRTSRRVRRVFDYLGAGLERVSARYRQNS